MGPVAVALGLRPHNLTVYLSPGCAFVTALRAPTDWPADIALELRFTAPEGGSETVWAATIVGRLAEWSELATAVDAVLAAGRTRARLIYIDPDGRELPWARGRVDVD